MMNSGDDYFTQLGRDFCDAYVAGFESMKKAIDVAVENFLQLFDSSFYNKRYDMTDQEIAAYRRWHKAYTRSRRNNKTVKKYKHGRSVRTRCKK